MQGPVGNTASTTTSADQSVVIFSRDLEVRSPRSTEAMKVRCRRHESLGEFILWSGAMRHVCFSVMLCVVVALGCHDGKGPPPPKPPPAPPRFANVAVDTINPGIGWFIDAQLYLRIQSSLNPQVEVLLPITVGPNKGKKEVIHQTLFALRPGEKETLLLEWLDDQSLTGEQRKMVLNAIEGGCLIVVLGGQIYVTKKPPDPNIAIAVGQLVRENCTPLVGKADIKEFKGLGMTRYQVPDDPPFVFRDINPIAILHQKRAQAEIRIYYPKR